MASIISNFIYSKFPQNEHTTKAAEIKSEIEGLSVAKIDTTSIVFKNRMTKMKADLQDEKETYLASLLRLNGEFFQDPNSVLKKTWDSVVKKVKAALNLEIKNRDQLEETSEKLKKAPQSVLIENARHAIGVYTSLETRRNKIEAELNEIISIEKADLTAPLSEKALRERQKELCGDYYEDPNCLLDKKWKEYQRALASSSPNASALLNAYNILENERKSNEILLQRIDALAPATPDRTIEALTLASISDRLLYLKLEEANEAALAGIDWKKTAWNASKVAALGGSYIVTQVLV